MSLPLTRRETPTIRADIARMRLQSMEHERWQVFRWARAVRNNTGGLSIAACTRSAALERIDFLMEYNDALCERVRALEVELKEKRRKNGA